MADSNKLINNNLCVEDILEINSLPDISYDLTERRCINPAIYAESVNNLHEDFDKIDLNSNGGEFKNEKRDLTNGLSRSFIENPCSNYSSNDSWSNYINNELLNTYRCNSLSSLTSSRPSINSKSRSTRVERRCKIINDSNDFYFDGDQDEVQRYSVNGYKVVKISTSLPNCTSKRPQSSSGKKLAYDDWIEKKRSEILEQKRKIAEIELNKKIEEEKLLKEKEEREKRERDNFKLWVEKKKREDLKKKLIAEKEMEIESRLEEIEAKTVVAKELYLKQWCRKKNKELKMQMNEKKLKTQQLEAEQKKRFEESVKAFEKWREKSKKCPKPATQGLLPHQQATPAYVNPVPWIDTTEEEN